MPDRLKRLVSLRALIGPLLFVLLGMVLLALALLAGLLALFDLPSLRAILAPTPLPALLLTFLGLWALAIGLWRLSSALIMPRPSLPSGDLVLGFQPAPAPPRVAVISGGAGILILASIGRQTRTLTAITPVQDPVEYYYRAASLLNFSQVLFVAPTPQPVAVTITLDDGQILPLSPQLPHTEALAARHGVALSLAERPAGVARAVTDALAQADLIVFGPGSLFESILPTLLLPEIRSAIQASRASTVYICSLMTEPSLTTGFSVADHIRQFQQIAGFTPRYVLVNAQRIDPDVRQIYAVANQRPVFLSPEEYEETAVPTSDRATARDLIVEGATVIEADLASAVVQLTASIDTPDESRTVRVLRHDPEKLAAALAEIRRRG
jgi:2-phospho-L-lactate transferase/gluconeogenesis factor (CofD/UPF0052 family)